VKIEAVPMTLKLAGEYVTGWHRHNKAPQGGMYAVGASYNGEIVGVAIVGRPVARRLADGKTLEVTRVCVVDHSPKGTCSFLYARCWKAVKALGWSRLITYTLQAESGASLRGAGWKLIAELPGGRQGWLTRPNRSIQSVIEHPKFRWEVQ
jgi:hypothetical protein